MLRALLPCLFGLEAALAAEVEAIGFTKDRITRPHQPGRRRPVARELARRTVPPESLDPYRGARAPRTFHRRSTRF